MRFVYLAFMILGSVVPLFLSLPHLQTYGFSPLAFVRHANSTSAAAACFADLALSAIVFLIFVVADSKRRRAPQWEFWVALVLLPVGIVTTISFYLYRRECSAK